MQSNVSSAARLQIQNAPMYWIQILNLWYVEKKDKKTENLCHIWINFEKFLPLLIIYWFSLYFYFIFLRRNVLPISKINTKTSTIRSLFPIWSSLHWMWNGIVRKQFSLIVSCVVRYEYINLFEQVKAIK